MELHSLKMQANLKCLILFFLAVVMIRQLQALCPSHTSNQAQIRAEVIKASDNVTFRGVRVSWTFADDYHSCTSVVALRVKIRSEGGNHRLLFPDGRDYIDITFDDNSVEFTNLACNYGYVFQITYSFHVYSSSPFYPGTSLFYGGSVISVPSKIHRVLAGPDVLDPKARLSISWDPLPCRLQNGANISEHIIQYRLANTNETQTIYASDDRLECIQQPIGPYKCYLTNTLLLEEETYILKVAAVNIYGIGPFSDPVNAILYSKANEVDDCILSNSTKLINKCDEVGKDTSQVVILGIQVVAMMSLIGIVIILLIILKILLWMRMMLTSQGGRLQKEKKDQMYTTECLAYGQIHAT